MEDPVSNRVMSRHDAMEKSIMWEINHCMYAHTSGFLITSIVFFIIRMITILVYSVRVNQC